MLHEVLDTTYFVFFEKVQVEHELILGIGCTVGYRDLAQMWIFATLKKR